MSPLSPPVLAAATLLSAPALWGALVTGTTDPATALTRVLVCGVLAWLALSVVAALVGPAPRAAAGDPARGTAGGGADTAADDPLGTGPGVAADAAPAGATGS